MLIAAVVVSIVLAVLSLVAIVAGAVTLGRGSAVVTQRQTALGKEVDASVGGSGNFFDLLAAARRGEPRPLGILLLAFGVCFTAFFTFLAVALGLVASGEGLGWAFLGFLGLFALGLLNQVRMAHGRREVPPANVP